MNNLPVAISMMIALSMPWGDLLFRSAFALVLNVYVYLMNDYFDIAVDLASDQKDQPKVAFMAKHKGATLGAIAGLGVLLAAAALIHGSLVLTLCLLANTIIIGTYSAWLKRLPIVDILMMVLWGGAMQLVAVPDANQALAWKLIGLVSLLCACYEPIQVIRDEPDDRKHGLVTTAVLLGTRATAWIYRVLVLVTTAYGVLLLESPVCWGFALAALLPLEPSTARRSWDLARVIFGLAWLGILATIYFGYLPKS
jgi:4-hydroxybenzoate polyprenyltransferase